MSFFDKLFNQVSKKEILRFNFYFSFDYLPKIIEDHNFRRVSFKEALKFDDLRTNHPEFNKIVSKIKILDTGVKNWPNVTLYLIIIPSNGIMPEVAHAIIGHESTLDVVKLYTMEYSVGGFAICNPSIKCHNNLGVFVKDGTQFGAFCLKDFLNYINLQIDSEY